jgi:hypothetical protein
LKPAPDNRIDSVGQTPLKIELGTGTNRVRDNAFEVSSSFESFKGMELFAKKQTRINFVAFLSRENKAKILSLKMIFIALKTV